MNLSSRRAILRIWRHDIQLKNIEDMEEKDKSDITDRQIFWINDFMRNSLEFEGTGESARQFMIQEFGLTEKQVDFVMSHADRFFIDLYFQLSRADFS